MASTKVCSPWKPLQQCDPSHERRTDPAIDLEELHHGAVSLHLHLYSFFNREARLERRDDLVQLYWSATTYLDRVFKLQRDGQLIHTPYHIMQLALAAGFALLKLLNSDFSARLPSEGRQYVLQTVEALRKSKVETNDLLDRFAEVLAQLWKESSRGRSLHSMSQSPVVGNPAIANMFNSNLQAPQQQQQHSSHRRDSSGEYHISCSKSCDIVSDTLQGCSKIPSALSSAAG
jgi:transcriptional regulatory protein LEU3